MLSLEPTDSRNPDRRNQGTSHPPACVGMPAKVLSADPMTPAEFMQEAIRLAEEGRHTRRGGPFGCVIVRRGSIVARGQNRVTSANDPTAHAEIEAIRTACRALGTFKLDDCELYTSCEPCPMCLAAIYWAHVPTVYYANTRIDAAAIGFDDDHIYREISAPIASRSVKLVPLLRDAAQPAFRAWLEDTGKTKY